MKTSNSFYLISKSLDKEFKGKYNLLRQLVEYMELYSLWKFQNKLQKDGSFFCSDNFIVNKLGFSRNTVIKNRKELKENGFIDFYTNQKEGSATYIKVNIEKIEKIQNGDEKEIIDDFESQNIFEAIAKNETTPEENLDNNSDGCNLLPAEKLTQIETSKNSEYKERIKNSWNLIAEKHNLSKIMMVSDVRLKKFKSSLKFFNFDEKTFFQKMHQCLKESNFLKGFGKDWKADFDFFITPSKAIKAFEGKYKDNPNKVMEILQDPARMSFKEAQEFREKIKMEQWLHEDENEKEEQKALP